MPASARDAVFARRHQARRQAADQPSPAVQGRVVEVQDEGSQLIAWLLGPRRGEMIADYCAGAWRQDAGRGGA
jgi:16S rRNA C967 or C1407 C5-methylase (RsmB/RsmF family)